MIEDGRDLAAGERSENADPDGSRRLPTLDHAGPRDVASGQDVFGLLIKSQSLWSWRDTLLTAGTIEQRRTKIVLKGLQTCRKGGLRDVQAFRRRCDGSALDHRTEKPELLELHGAMPPCRFDGAGI